MRYLFPLFVLSAALFALVAVGHAPSQTQTPGVNAGGEVDFGKKLLVCTIRKTADGQEFGSTYLENAKVRRLGDRFFLVGNMARNARKENAFKDVPAWFPISEVVQILEFESLEAAEEAFRKAGK